jgi:plasmid stabilization system protein ParE
MNVVYHTDAFEEYQQAVIHYINISQSLGKQFYERIESAVTLIREQPSAWTRVSTNVRRITVKQFPYSIFFSEYNDGIIILAVAHQKRKPSLWKQRKSE